MNLCDKYDIYCFFYTKQGCKEEEKVCAQWRKTYEIFEKDLNNKQKKEFKNILKKIK